jgi:hypothetical protein
LATTPAWLALFAPLPDHAVIERKPVASAELVASGKADQENVGGRFEEDGSFRGTRWLTHTEQIGDDDENAQATSLPSPPSEQDVASLRAIIGAVMKRAPGRREGEPR